MARRLRGVAAAPGIAIAPLVHFHGGMEYIPTRAVAPEEVEREVGRLREAIDHAAGGIHKLRAEMTTVLSDRDAMIFDAQLALLNDRTFQAAMERVVRDQLVNCEVALQRVIAEYEKAFEAMQDAAMRERAADVRDVGRQVLGALMERERKVYTAGGQDYIFAADEFLPSDTGILDRRHIRGIVTARGGKYSHGAILARSLGIPAVVAVEDVLIKVQSGTQVALDGDNGVVVAEPGEEELVRYRQLVAERQDVERKVREARFQPAATSDGVSVELLVNVESVRDLGQIELDAVAGIGLFRTEFAFMERRTFPTEEEQRAMYKNALEAARGKPVTFRTLDVGGEKVLSYFRMPEERNPQLGWRGIRIGLDWPDLFYTQIRAILRAAGDHHVRILLPMVSGYDEVRRCREAVDQILEDLHAAGQRPRGKVELGAMVEIPAFVHVMDQVLPLVDFFSVGTNDLVQYSLAVDRDNPRVAGLYDPFQPAILRILRQIAHAAAAGGKPVAVCGEIAGDHHFTPLLLGLGYRQLSMAPVFVPRVKLAVRGFSLGECREMADAALAMTSAAAIRGLLRERVRAASAAMLAGSLPGPGRERMGEGRP